VRRVYQVASLVFLALGLYVVAEARRMEYLTPLGPGPGFFPFWLGLLMVLFSLGWLAQVSLGSVESMPEDFVTDAGGAMRLLAVLVALILFTGLVDRIGYCLAMLAFAFGLLVGVGRHNPVASLVIALAGSFGLYYIFRHWLGMQLPPSSLEFLAELGF
jgi:putative tricarboxylic transport membrane protein